MDHMLYGPAAAMAPRLHTDTLFQLPAGSVRFNGWLMDSIRFIEKKQLLDAPLWALFVRQFRNGSVDDHDHGWRCEYWGKLMRGGCFVYACTMNEELYQVLTDTVCDLLSAQDEQGRISTYSPAVEFHGWDLWGRKYVMLGLEYFLEICQDEALRQRILATLIRHADYMLEHLGSADEGKLEINDCTNHWDGLNSSSILEPFVRLYSLTGLERYLDFADYIVSRGGTKHTNIFELAYEGRLYPYEYPVTKAYEMMSCFEGLLEYYRVTGVSKWRVAVENFARLVAKSDVTLIGCCGCTHELFDHSAVRQLDAAEKGIMQETCVTVTWMKVCYQLLSLTGDSFFADHMERSIYNALVGSINTENAPLNHGLPFDSYSPLLPGTRGRKTGGYKTMEDGAACYGCCAAIGAAGLGLIGMSSVLAARDGLAVNLFLNGEATLLTPAGQRLTLTTQTAYPVDGRVSITLTLRQAESFAVYLRIPQWSAQTTLTISSEPVKRVTPGSYVRLKRVWTQGDVIDLTLDMRVRRILPEAYQLSSKDAPFEAYCRGPLVLARDARLGDDVDVPIAPCGSEYPEAQLAAEDRIPNLLAVDLPQPEGHAVRLIDYASCGKTWDKESRMTAWIAVKA